VLTEAINWITLAIGDFLLPAFNVKALLGWAKEDLGSANAATRTAAVQMLGCLHTFLGPPLGELQPMHCYALAAACLFGCLLVSVQCGISCVLCC
jgi:hypothetical protein